LQADHSNNVISESVKQRSNIPLNEIKVSTDKLQQIPVKALAATKGGGSLTTCQALALAGTLICIAAVASVTPALVYSLKTNNDNNCMFFISTLFQRNRFHY
jgi:hypothetical protein